MDIFFWKTIAIVLGFLAAMLLLWLIMALCDAKKYRKKYEEAYVTQEEYRKNCDDTERRITRVTADFNRVNQQLEKTNAKLAESNSKLSKYREYFDFYRRWAHDLMED